MAYSIIADVEEVMRSQVYTPDVVVVLDPKLPETVDVLEGLQEEGSMIYNSAESIKEVHSRLRIASSRIAVVDATSISLDILGIPMPNTPMLGAFSKFTKIITLKSALKAVKKQFSGALLEKNMKATKRGFKEVNFIV